MMRSPSWRKWRRRQGTWKGSSCSRDQGSKATSRCFPSASTLYPRVLPRPDRKVDAGAEISASDIRIKEGGEPFEPSEQEPAGCARDNLLCAPAFGGRALALL